MRILVVDDKEENLLLLETLLTGKGCEVKKAVNGKIALEILKNESFDIIVSDILMPIMDGYDLCRICKSDPDLRDIIFIFYTATYTDLEDEKYAMQLGADKFLIKPMDPKQFLSEICDFTKKAEKHKIAPNEPKITDMESLKIHRDRLLNKLGKKVDELEHEIYERKKVEAQLHKSLKEKEILLRELYHRTKNNMQVISSMLRIRSRSITNPEIKDILFDLEYKIFSMAMAHQKLYESEDLSQLNLKEYIKNLVSMIKNIYVNLSNNINFSVKGDDVYVLIDTAIPCGLIISELITNSIRHAFADQEKGNIEIKLQISETNELIIDISDDGIGLPEDFDLDKNIHIGLKSVIDLIENQLKGKIDLSTQNGLSYHITIKEELYKSRI